MFRSKAERKVAEAGYDPARLPPGPVPDREVAGPPRRGHVASYPADLAGWNFRVLGEVDHPITLELGRAERAPEGRR